MQLRLGAIYAPSVVRTMSHVVILAKEDLGVRIAGGMADSIVDLEQKEKRPDLQIVYWIWLFV